MKLDLKKIREKLNRLGKAPNIMDYGTEGLEGLRIGNIEDYGVDPLTDEPFTVETIMAMLELLEEAEKIVDHFAKYANGWKHSGEISDMEACFMGKRLDANNFLSRLRGSL